MPARPSEPPPPSLLLSRRALLVRAGVSGVAAAGLVGAGARAQAPLPAPKGKVLLSMGGKLGVRNRGGRAEFDLAMLESLPQASFTTMTPWEDAPVKFSGPLLRDVLSLVGAQGTQLRAVALNDYRIDIPIADTRRFDLLLALRVNDALIPVRNKGPLFIIYPFDSDRRLQSAVYYERSIWQLKAIEVE